MSLKRVAQVLQFARRHGLGGGDWTQVARAHAIGARSRLPTRAAAAADEDRLRARGGSTSPGLRSRSYGAGEIRTARSHATVVGCPTVTVHGGLDARATRVGTAHRRVHRRAGRTMGEQLRPVGLGHREDAATLAAVAVAPRTPKRRVSLSPSGIPVEVRRDCRRERRRLRVDAGRLAIVVRLLAAAHTMTAPTGISSTRVATASCYGEGEPRPDRRYCVRSARERQQGVGHTGLGKSARADPTAVALLHGRPPAQGCSSCASVA